MTWTRASVAILTLAACALRASAQGEEQFIPEEAKISCCPAGPDPLELEILGWMSAALLVGVIPFLAAIATLLSRNWYWTRMLSWACIAAGVPASCTVLLQVVMPGGTVPPDLPWLIQFGGPFLLIAGLVMLRVAEAFGTAAGRVSEERLDSIRHARRKAGVTLPRASQ